MIHWENEPRINIGSNANKTINDLQEKQEQIKDYELLKEEMKSLTQRFSSNVKLLDQINKKDNECNIVAIHKLEKYILDKNKVILELKSQISEKNFHQASVTNNKEVEKMNEI